MDEQLAASLLLGGTLPGEPPARSTAWTISGSAAATRTGPSLASIARRQTWTIIGVSGVVGGPVRTMSHIRSTRPGEPSVWTNVVSPSRPAIRPTWVRIASTVAGDMSWFFGENGSIDGQIVV